MKFVYKDLLKVEKESLKTIKIIEEITKVRMEREKNADCADDDATSNATGDSNLKQS